MRILHPARPTERRRGFSLVEVALAIAVLGVAMVGLLALFPSGISNFRQAMDTTVTANIGQRLLNEAQQTDFALLIDQRNLPADPKGQSLCPEEYSFRAPRVAQPEYRYFDEEGNEIGPIAGQLSPDDRRRVVYQVNIRVRPRAAMLTTSSAGNSLAQVTVQVIRNPALVELPLETDATSPEFNLVRPPSAFPVFTYAALVGRNDG